MLQVYCWIVVAAMWLNIVRLLYAFRLAREFDTFVHIQLCSIAWSLLSTLNATSCLLASHRRSCFAKFFLHWQRLDAHGGPLIEKTKIRRTAVTVSIISWILIIFAVASSLVVLFASDVLHVVAVDPVVKISGVEGAVMIVVFCILQTYMSAAWILPAGFQLLLSISISREFRCISRNHSII